MAKVPYKRTIEGMDGRLFHIEQHSEDDNALVVLINDTRGQSLEVMLSKPAVLRFIAQFAQDLADELQ